MLKIGVKILAVIAFCLMVAVAQESRAGGTAVEAEELVKKALEYMKVNGVENAIAAFNKPDGEFVKDDLYIFMFQVSDKEASRIITLAHPVNPGLIGKDLHDLKDPSGNQFMVAMAHKAMKENGGWVDYKWSHPLTKKIGDKSSFCLPCSPDAFIGCGIYK